MTPTVTYVESKIREFNDLIFGSCLPPIPVKLSHARTFLGKVQYRRKRGISGGFAGNTDFLMRISTMFDLTEMDRINREFGRNITVSYRKVPRC